MLRIARALANPRFQVWFNGLLMAVWTAVLFATPFAPTLQHSLLWLTEISLWALVATHLGAWIAALVNVRAEALQGHAAGAVDRHDEVQRRLDHIIKHSPKIPDFNG